MKKKSLAFFALNVIALSACSYNPFNDFLGIGVDIVIPTSDRLNAFQNYNYLFWDKNEECEGYDVYLYEDVLPSSSSSSSKANSSLKSSRSSKSSLSSSKANNDPVANTSSCNYPVQDAWVGKQIKVVGYKYEASSEGVYSEKKTVAESEKIIITDNVAPLTDPDYLFYDDDTLRYLFRNRDYGTITIPETATHVVIENVSRNYYPTFEFSPREDNSVVWIELINSALVGKTSYSNPTRFRYLGNNKNVSFYFHVLGHNEIKGVGSTVSAKPTIDLPIVVFNKDYIFDSVSPELTVFGSNPEVAGDSAGYAIKADRIINYLHADVLKLIGGDGAPSTEYNQPGGTGQLPIEEKTAAYSVNGHSIGLKAGDGGYGLWEKGGNAYKYNYMINRVYKKYADAFYCLEEASVGSSSLAGSGQYIDIEQDSSSSSSR